MSRFEVLSDQQWARVEAFMPVAGPQGGRPFVEHRRVVEAIVYRYRTGIPWRDLPRERFGPWQTVWKRHRRFAGDGTWDKVLRSVQGDADAAGDLDWRVSVDSTINRAHQHARVHHPPGPAHRGLCRITRIPAGHLTNLQVTGSDGPGVGSRRRSTTPWTGTGDPSRSSWDRDKATTGGC